ncbi:hypothetical protein A2U01_0116514, partial [Trifolium medium]|nr:hypothetical protein [Trifolium medium]
MGFAFYADSGAEEEQGVRLWGL